MSRWSATVLVFSGWAAVAVAGCASDSSAGHRTTPPAAASRPITPRAKLPAAILPLLPRHGVYVAGGGLVSAAWRVVVDIDAKTIYGGTASKPSSASFGPMEKQSTRALSARNEELLMKLAHEAWAEPAPAQPPEPTADYDEIFVVLEGDDAFYLEGFGPIRRPTAAKAIIELRAAAGL